MSGVHRLLLATSLLASVVATRTSAEPTDGSHRAAAARIIALPPLNYSFTIDPKTPIEDLMPIPPKAAESLGPMLDDDLTKVPEVMLYDPSAIDIKPKDKLKVTVNAFNEVEFVEGQIAHQIAKINYLNKEKKDRFIELLIAKRPDLAGLPFVMGAACRQDVGQATRFKGGVGLVQNVLLGLFEHPKTERPNWERLETEQRGNVPEVITAARIAALLQILGPEAKSTRKGLANFLSKLDHTDATRALTRLAVFTLEKEIREAALKGIAMRALSTETLEITRTALQEGLRYPWPAVAQHSAEAIAFLKRQDLIPDLVEALDQPDPRAPYVMKDGGKKVTMVREVVRINHHRNCLLCHAPGNTPDLFAPPKAEGPASRQRQAVRSDLVLAPVPLLGHPFASSSGSRYGDRSSPDILVRVDVTYLRQDFSMLMQVADAKPWPDKQRFDFMVRTRIIDEKEAKRYHELLAKSPSPYRTAVHTALKALTGRDAEPNAAAWRKVLEKKTTCD